MLDRNCTICGNRENNRIYRVKERMLNRGEQFNYLLCSRCGTLQLVDSIDNMGQYYRNNYYAYKRKADERDRGIFRKRLKAWAYLNFVSPEKADNSFFWSDAQCLYPIKGMRLRKNSKILDVGCGSGAWLERLNELGYSRLYGMDKFAPDFTSKKFHFIQGDIYSAENVGGYDLITLHHSFEHMENPLEILGKIKNLLAVEGRAIIRIPVMGKAAWKQYGTDWYQIDAPRHLYIYSEKAIKYMCKKAGLEIYRVVYDSEGSQFYLSEGYMRTDKSCSELEDGYQLGRRRAYNEKAKALNKKRQGDQAIFYIRRKKEVFSDDHISEKADRK